MKEINMVKKYIEEIELLESMGYGFWFENKYIEGCACYYRRGNSTAVVIADDYDCTVTIRFYEGRRLTCEIKQR